MFDDLFLPAAQTLRSVFLPLSHSLQWPGTLLKLLFFTEYGLILLFGLYMTAAIAAGMQNAAARKASGQCRSCLCSCAVGAASGFPKTLQAAFKLWIVAGVVVSLQFVSDTIAQSTERICRLYEMRQVVEQLSEQTEIAELRVVERRCGSEPDAEDCPPDQVTTTVEITFYSGDDAQKSLVQRYELPGREVYLASLIFNFDRSLFATGEHRNLCIPYALYSERLPRAEALRIQTSEARDIPIYYQRDDESIYGLAPQIFRDRAEELMKILDSPEQSRKEGIRTSQGILHGSAIHKILPVGERYTLYLHQADGLSLKKNASF
jgi:hypothetical protein